MKYFLVLLLLFVLVLIWMEIPRGVPRWEYKILEVRNDDDIALDHAYLSKSADKLTVQAFDSGAGMFDLYGVTNAENIDDIGQQGWELVSAVAQTETRMGTGGPPNTRTA